ncbi:MAG: FKBP-type peptidyl-prolyl cis-trans isomerase [Weeksellaceae bacterium]
MQKNWKTLWYSLILIGIMTACKKNPPQYPTTYKNVGFMDYSKEFNKQLKDLEMEKIEQYIRNHKEDYLYTNAGFYMTRTRMDSLPRVENFDTIRFQYQVSNLMDSIIYTYEEQKINTIVLGQSSIIPGLEYGLKRMSEGEEATILIPSSLGYGVSGDGHKIGADQPLKIEIKLNELKQNEN